MEFRLSLLICCTRFINHARRRAVRSAHPVVMRRRGSRARRRRRGVGEFPDTAKCRQIVTLRKGWCFPASDDTEFGF